jgi:hypothetical protein
MHGERAFPTISKKPPENQIEIYPTFGHCATFFIVTCLDYKHQRFPSPLIGEGRVGDNPLDREEKLLTVAVFVIKWQNQK